METNKIRYPKREIVTVEFNSFEEIGKAIEQSNLFSIENEINLLVSVENFNLFNILVLKEIKKMNEVVAEYSTELIPLDVFFLPNHPKKLIRVRPCYIFPPIEKEKSIIEVLA